MADKNEEDWEKEDGLRRWIWPFVLAQNVLNLLYAGLALWPEPSQIGMGTITVVVAVERGGADISSLATRRITRDEGEWRWSGSSAGWSLPPPAVCGADENGAGCHA